MSLFDNIYPTEFDVPADGKYFQDDIYGIGGVCKAVNELLTGKVKKIFFKTGKRDENGWKETGGFVLKMGKREGIPVVIHDDSSLIASWYGYDAVDPARVVGTIIAKFGHVVFRQKV